MKRRFASRGSSRPARPMDWECAQTQVTALDVGSNFTGAIVAANWIVTPDKIRQDYTDPTLMATRWFLGFQFSRTAAGGAQDRIFAAAGIIAWDSIDDGIPVFPPGPITHCDLDWINRYVFQFSAGAPSGSGGPGDLWDNVHLSKAKRRLGNDRGILICFEGFGFNPSEFDKLNIGADVRCLIKE